MENCLKIYPRHGFLNTEYKVRSEKEESFTILFNGQKMFEGVLKAGETKVLPKFNVAGEYIVISNRTSEIQKIIVEDAYRFGGSELNYAFLAKYSTSVFLVMLDRLYIYNYSNSDFWMENGLCPDSIEDLNEDLYLFKSNRKSRSNDSITRNDYYGVFSLIRKKILFSFNELIAYTNQYILYIDSQSENVCIYFYTIDLCVYVEMAKFIFDSHKDCLYYTVDKDNSIYKTANLNDWEVRQCCLYAHTDGTEMYVEECSTINSDNPLTTCCYDAKHGDFIDFLGTHYAIFDNKVVDLRTLEEKSIPYSPNRIINGNNDALKDNLQKLCDGNQQFLFAGRKENAFMTIRYKDITTYATENNLYWIEKICLLYNDAYKNKTEVQHCILHSLYPIHWDVKELNNIHLSPSTRISISEENNIHVNADNISFYIDENCNVVEKIADKTSIDVQEERPYPGVLYCKKTVVAWDIEKDVIVVKNGGKYSIGIWDELLNRYIIDESVDDIIDKSSYGDAIFFADGNGVLIKDQRGKHFQWMDNSGNLQNLELDDTQFIRKGINGYLPLVSFDSFRRPVFVDPVTFSEISPSYLCDYVFTSSDKALYARNNHLEDIKYFCESTGNEIDFNEYCKLFSDYNYPEYINECRRSRRRPDLFDCNTRNNSIRPQSSETVKENRRRLIKDSSISFENIKNLYNNQGLILRANNIDEAIEELSECKQIDFVKIIAFPQQYVTILNADHKVHDIIRIGEPLWFLNYVSFSYDNRYVAISGRYPDGLNAGGLLFVYDLHYQRTAFDSSTEPRAYDAVWLSAFDRNGNIASYSSEPITRILSLNENNYYVKESMDEKSFLAFSRTGKFIALSDQGYTRYDDKHNWGHKPSCNIYIRNEYTKKIFGPFNDFGLSSQSGRSSIVGTGERRETVSSVSFSADEKQYLAVSNDGVVIVRNIQCFDK